MGRVHREDVFHVGMVAAFVLWCTVYWRGVVPWWLARAAPVCRSTRIGVVETVWHLWVSSDCTWHSSTARWMLPALFTVAVFYIVLLGCLARDWRQGPPDWACGASGFGFGVLVFLAGSASFLWLLWTRFLADSAFVRTGHETILWIGSVAAVVFAVLGLFAWLGNKLGHATAEGMRGSGVASGPVAVVGSTLGATAGVSIAVVAAGALLFALFIYAAWAALCTMVTVGMISALVGKR